MRLVLPLSTGEVFSRGVFFLCVLVPFHHFIMRHPGQRHALRFFLQNYFVFPIIFYLLSIFEGLRAGIAQRVVLVFCMDVLFVRCVEEAGMDAQGGEEWWKLCYWSVGGRCPPKLLLWLLFCRAAAAINVWLNETEGVNS